MIGESSCIAQLSTPNKRYAQDRGTCNSPFHTISPLNLQVSFSFHLDLGKNENVSLTRPWTNVSVSSQFGFRLAMCDMYVQLQARLEQAQVSGGWTINICLICLHNMREAWAGKWSWLKLANIRKDWIHLATFVVYPSGLQLIHVRLILNKLI